MLLATFHRVCFYISRNVTRRARPDWLTLGGVVDVAQLGAVVVAAAAETVSKTRRLSVVGVVSRHVTAMTAVMRLHLASTVHRALIARTALLRAPANKPPVLLLMLHGSMRPSLGHCIFVWLSVIG